MYSAPTFIICLPFDFFSASLELSPSAFSFFLSLDSSSSVNNDGVTYLKHLEINAYGIRFDCEAELF